MPSDGLQDDANETLSLQLLNDSSPSALSSVCIPPSPSSNTNLPSIGVSGMIKLSVPATLSLAILGSVRTIRDYTEGGGFLVPRIQDAIVTTALGGEKGGFSFSRTWLDNKTIMSLDFIPTASGPDHQIQLDNQTLRFDAGAYRFSAHLDYPQPAHLSPRVVFNPDSQGLFHEQPDDAKSL